MSADVEEGRRLRDAKRFHRARLPGAFATLTGPAGATFCGFWEECAVRAPLSKLRPTVPGTVEAEDSLRSGPNICIPPCGPRCNHARLTSKRAVRPLRRGPVEARKTRAARTTIFGPPMNLDNSASMHVSPIGAAGDARSRHPAGNPPGGGNMRFSWDGATGRFGKTTICCGVS